MRENAWNMAADDDSDDVLSRLPKTRPARRSTRRASAQAGAQPAAERAAAKPRTAAKPKPKTAAKAAPKPRAKAAPKPKAVTPAPPPPAEAVRKPIEPPTGSEILHTAVQAAGDIAQVGLVIGREALKAARSKLPGGR